MELERLIGFDPQLLHDAFIMGINIFILFFALSYLLFNPARDLLKRRQEKIAGELDDAALKQKEAGELKAEYEAKLKNIEKEAEQILEDARKKARLREEEIVNEAKAEALRITQRADKEIELEKKKAVDELKQEMINIASLMASRAVSSSMNIDIESRLVDETLKEMSESTWQS